MLLHDFGNSHAVCFDLLFISFDFTVALRDLALQQSDPTQCVFLFGRKYVTNIQACTLVTCSI